MVIQSNDRLAHITSNRANYYYYFIILYFQIINVNNVNIVWQWV